MSFPLWFVSEYHKTGLGAYEVAPEGKIKPCAYQHVRNVGVGDVDLEYLQVNCKTFLVFG